MLFVLSVDGSAVPSSNGHSGSSSSQYRDHHANMMAQAAAQAANHHRHNYHQQQQQYIHGKKPEEYHQDHALTQNFVCLMNKNGARILPLDHL